MTDRQIYKDFKKIRKLITSTKSFSVIKDTVSSHYAYCYGMLSPEFWVDIGISGRKKRLAVIDKEIEFYKNKLQIK